MACSRRARPSGRLGDRDAERLAKAEAAQLATRAEADARRRARAL